MSPVEKRSLAFDVLKEEVLRQQYLLKFLKQRHPETYNKAIESLIDFNHGVPSEDLELDESLFNFKNLSFY